MSAGHAHHHHGHDHGHSHAPADFGRAFAIGIALNLAFVVVEAAVGFTRGSMALVADAGHNLSDVLGLVVAWAGVAIGKRRGGPRFTYGLRGSTILAALFNALFLLVAMGAIALEAVRRIGEDVAVPGATVMIVAGIGIVVNGATALLFARGQKGDINIRGAYLHMAADAGVSAGVVVAGFVIQMTGLAWIDPAVSLVIVAVILWGTWGLLRDSVSMSLLAVPEGIDVAAVDGTLRALPGVERVHHVHIWPLSTTETALTAHVVMPRYPGLAFFEAAKHRLEHDFGIGHVTLQVELTEGCAEGDCG
ncbi:cation diffusion facilitator family transporter [Sphingomonas sp. ID0503]|uniref:cation diffusion facilitator family transporter n=1 Tax=Sphingomonas sp. ID0503 TaxID=3399691 RepID=UPI003AFB0770